MNKTSPRLARAFFAATLSSVLGAAASAQTDGWYAGAEAGAAIVPTIGFKANANSWQQQQDLGYEVLGQVGYGFGQIRLEGELGFRQNGLSKFSDSAGNPSPGGSIGGVSGMADIYYDIDTHTRFTPFLGAGVGALDLSANHISAGGVGVTDASRVAFAYQGIAGVSYAVNDALSIKADYRYLRAERTSLPLESGYGAGNGSGAYASHAILVGFTFKFAPPKAMAATQASTPPPPPAAPMVQAPAAKPVAAAPIAKNFMVFFDWDKSELTPEARTIIVQAADNARKNHSVVVNATGYTDLSGTAPYNLKLSVRRGEAVKKMMVELGIPADEISVVGKGKSDPLISTQDGVREAQNRRVTITLE